MDFLVGLFDVPIREDKNRGANKLLDLMFKAIGFFFLDGDIIISAYDGLVEVEVGDGGVLHLVN